MNPEKETKGENGHGFLCGRNNKHLYKYIVAVLALASLFLLAKSIFVFKSIQYIGKDPSRINSIIVSGKGEIITTPDIAEVSFNISEEAASVKVAQERVTLKMNSIIKGLADQKIKESDIKTTNYNIYPRYEYMTEPCKVGFPCIIRDGKRVLVGYNVSHSVTLKIRKIEEAGKVLSFLGESGVSEISGLSFIIEDEDEKNAEARKLAIDDAKTRAKILAKDLGVQLVRIIEFSSSGYRPIYFKTSALEDVGGGGAIAVPEIPTGENKITSEVSITYEIR